MSTPGTQVTIIPTVKRCKYITRVYSMQGIKKINFQNQEHGVQQQEKSHIHTSNFHPVTGV